MAEDEAVANMKAQVAKLPYKTHFGPEEHADEILDTWQRERIVKKVQNIALKQQVRDKVRKEKLHVVNNIEQEHKEFLDNHACMDEKVRKRQQSREYVTKYWRDQMKEKEGHIKMEKEADKAYHILPTDI